MLRKIEAAMYKNESYSIEIAAVRLPSDKDAEVVFVLKDKDEREIGTLVEMVPGNRHDLSRVARRGMHSLAQHLQDLSNRLQAE